MRVWSAVIPQNSKLDFPTLSSRQEEKLDMKFFMSLCSVSINLIKSSYRTFSIYYVLRCCKTKFRPTVFRYIGAGDKRSDKAFTWQKQPLELLYKKEVLKNFPKFTGKISVVVSFLITLKALGTQLYQKSDSSRISLRVLRHF